MAMKKITLLFTVVSILAVVGNVDSATPHQSPPPAVDCGSIILNLADCLSFVSNGSTVTKPEGTCCSGLKTVLKTDAQCLCEGFKNSAKLGVTLNITNAMALPSACHVSAPPLSNCVGSSVAPSTAPAISPSVALPPSIIDGAPTSTAGITDVTPAPAPASAGSSSVLAVSTGSFVLSVVVSALSFF